MARIEHRIEPSVDQLRTVEGGEDLKYPVNLVAAAVKRDARDAGFAAPLFDVRSGYRSIASQEVLWERALERYGSAEAADDWVAPPGRSSHHTGGAMDFWLGYGINSRNVEQIEATEAYRYLRDVLAPKYKLAAYSREPWHWECDAACEENILAMEGIDLPRGVKSTKKIFGKILFGTVILTAVGGASFLIYTKKTTGEWLP